MVWRIFLRLSNKILAAFDWAQKAVLRSLDLIVSGVASQRRRGEQAA
jgi:hypothetical protein